MPAKPKGNPFAFKHVRAAYRSGLEAATSAALMAAGVTFLYEQVRVPFTQPAKSRTYTPDFLLPNGIIVETKGIFAPDDRAKHLLVRAQHPDLDIRLVFSNARAKVTKGGSVTYGDWAAKAGIPYAHKVIPPAWLEEPVGVARLSAATALLKKA